MYAYLLSQHAPPLVQFKPRNIAVWPWLLCTLGLTRLEAMLIDKFYQIIGVIVQAVVYICLTLT